MSQLFVLFPQFLPPGCLTRHGRRDAIIASSGATQARRRATYTYPLDRQRYPTTHCCSIQCEPWNLSNKHTQPQWCGKGWKILPAQQWWTYWHNAKDESRYKRGSPGYHSPGSLHSSQTLMCTLTTILTSDVVLVPPYSPWLTNKQSGQTSNFYSHSKRHFDRSQPDCKDPANV